MTEYIKILSAILPPIFVLFAVYIIWYRKKLRLDLFDKRYEVYHATNKFLSQIMANRKISDEELSSFLMAKHKSYFLFGEDVEQYMNYLYDKGCNLKCTEKRLESVTIGDEESKKVFDEELELLKGITKELSKCKNLFGKYMRFKQL